MASGQVSRRRTLGVSLGAAQGPPPRVAPGEPDPNKGGQTSEKAKPAAEKSDATGIPECDKYFAAVNACIASKTLSKEDQQAAELNVNRLRTMLPMAKAPQGRDTLVKRCTASLESAQKDGRYACCKSGPKASERAR
jgi:hypothetical protein